MDKGALRTVQDFGFGNEFGNPVQCIDHILALQALAYIDGQASPRVVIHDRQSPQTPAIEQRIGHNVHPPVLGRMQ
jgi:hypothetical protein